jgi:hypothetical protein
VRWVLASFVLLAAAFASRRTIGSPWETRSRSADGSRKRSRRTRTKTGWSLQRRAWVTFLLDRTPEAIASYEALLDRPGLERRMHDEALMMLGAMFADTDWNRDGLTDSISAIDRLADASLIRQDAPYLAALHFETARALYLQSRDPAAIALLAVALARWPPPANGTPLVPACRRHRARPTTLRGEDPAVRQATDALCATLAP